MPNINIKIRNKVAKADRAIIVCDNSDYIAHFDFDAEWDAYTTKTARFVYGGRYTDVVFSGNECPVPVIQDTRAVTVGVFAGDLHTTTPAYFACVPSILCCNGIPADPTPDVYAQIMELLNKESGIWYPAVDDAGNMSWTRSISETEPQPVNIKGPKGDAGADGVGIPGADGKDGVDGKSAYELAQDNGFQGTMQEWLASLVGADGTNGADGNDGISPAVSVAAITGGNRVTITDAEGAKTFDVMDGAQGASGADGKDYVLTNADKQEIAKAAAGLVDVPSVQPDWNQNDSTAADYVRNRPFYTGNPVETVLVEESTVSFADQGGVYSAQFPSTFEATVGETYKVYWDGTAYECTCVDYNSYPVIGNLSIMGAGSDTGDPFLMVVNNGRVIDIYTADTSASHTLSISRFAQEVVKIDEKYLPDTVATKSEVEATQEVLYGVFSSVATFTFDKQTSGRDTFVLNAFHYYKISDFNPSTSDVISFKGTNELGEEYSGIYTGNNCDRYGALFIVVASAGVCSIAISETTTMSFTAPSAGLYAQYEEGNQNMTAGTGEFTLRSSTGSFPITGLLLKSSTADSSKKFKITVDDSGTLTATEVS